MATMKDMEQVLSQIDRMRSIASRWLATETVSAMERDLMLDKLRMLYEEILFWEGERLTPEESVEPPVKGKEEKSLASMKEDPAGAVASSLESTEVVASPANEPAPQSGSEATAEASMPAGSETVVEEASQPMAWTRSHASTTKDPMAEPKLFSDEAHVRTRVDKQVILSLYGDDSPSMARPFVGAHQPPAQPEVTVYESVTVSETPSEAEPMREPIQTAQPVEPEVLSSSESSAQPEPSAPVDQPLYPETTTTPVGGISSESPKASGYADHSEATLASTPHTTKVLGEIIVTPTESLGDRLGKQHPHTDVASRLRAQTITDLQHSIGINDRFLLINELFGGDAALYEQTLARLNEFTSLDDAMIYIQEHFDWNPDAAGTTFLVELLERKLEN